MQANNSTPLNILHISNWYPNSWHSHEGIFIKNQFDVFSEVTNSKLINIQSRKSHSLFSFNHKINSDKEEGYFILSSIPWQVAHEIFTTLLLVWVIFRKKANNFDLIHIHIAYPLLVHYWLWKYLIKKPIIISEHWSAYHYNFYLPKENKKLDRIKSIFNYKFPLITVSNALLLDIRKFSKNEYINSYIIPNIIDKCYLNGPIYKNLKSPLTFFTVNIWRDIKNPFPMLEAFSRLSKNGYDFNLLIGGYGPLLANMIDYVKSTSLINHTQFLGKLDSSQIFECLKESDAYLFSSEYETFSIACAQALCTGTPLLGPKIEAIAEYATQLDWKIVKSNDSDEWYNSLTKFIQNRDEYDHEKIASRAREKFNTERIRDQYLGIVKKIIYG